MKKIGNIFNFAFDFNSKIKIKIFPQILNFNFLKKKGTTLSIRMRKLHEEFPSNQACCLNFRYLTKSLPRENLSN